MPVARQPVERAELFLAQPLVDVDRHAVPAGRAQRDRGRLLGAHVRRGQHRVDRVEVARAPASQRRRLPLAQLRERHVAVAASRCRSPRAPPASARSRATFPALSACRIMNSSLGQPISTREVPVRGYFFGGERLQGVEGVGDVLVGIEVV